MYKLKDVGEVQIPAITPPIKIEVPHSTRICPTCYTIIDNPRENQIYCNQKCYSKSPKLREQAKKSSMIRKNKEEKWHEGHNHSDKTRKQISQNTSKKIGKLNPLWKGDQVGYDALHDWVLRNKIFIGKCEICKLESNNRRVIQAANISGEYKRDINDFVWLCNRCHYAFDSIKRANQYGVIGCEVKSNGYLTKEEKEKCKWLLDNNVFSKILIAKKGTKRGGIIYDEFGTKNN